MATISSTGIGSGLDLNGLLDQLVDAERVPTENRLNLKEADLQAEISAFGSVKSVLSGFQTSISKLGLTSNFNSNNISVANASLFSASASSIADEGSYNVEVKQLASSQSLASTAFTEVSDVIGTGTLTFEFGTTVYDSG
ncbi:MAG: flagellar hook protein, partial [Gammaproteobacteria bacterium]|nr:flagellar hook protein [Gammaproteobacteria bacterium]